MADNVRDFKGVWIPKEIWLDNRLTMLEKGVLIEVDSLDCEEKGCFASNQYLAEFCQCSETKVSNAISKLIELDYLYMQSFDGRTRILKSRLTKSEWQTYKICKADLQKVQDSNISNNIVNKIDYKYIVGLLNEKAKTNYRHTTPKTQQFIKARFNEGFTQSDFEKVIDNMVAKWGKDKKMQQYLRPETLFGTKFESYLNMPITTKRGNEDVSEYDELWENS